MDAGVVEEREESAAEGVRAGLVIDHSHLDAFRIAADTQTHQTDLNHGQQELKAQRTVCREKGRNRLRDTLKHKILNNSKVNAIITQDFSSFAPLS